jgi:hypothetical protein
VVARSLTITEDLSVPANGDAPIIGRIQFTEGPPTSTVPEPTTLALLSGASLMGVVRYVPARLRRGRPVKSRG